MGTSGEGRGVSMLAVLGGAVLWGLSGTAAQALFQRHAVDPGWLVSIRMSVSGLLMLLALAVRRGLPAVLAPLRSVRSAMSLVIFGVVGLVVVQYSYLVTIEASNAATATLLQYLAPAMVVLWTSLAGRRLPPRLHAVALGLTLVGTFLLVTAGPTLHLQLSPRAVWWGLLSAAALAFYTLYPGPLLRALGAPLVVGWGLVLGGAAVAPFAPPWAVPAHLSGGDLALVGFVVVLGTLIAFTLYLYGLTRLTPVLASLLATAEPLAAAVAGVLWLHVHLDAWQWVGGGAIAGGVLLLARTPRRHSSPGRATG